MDDIYRRWLEHADPNAANRAWVLLTEHFQTRVRPNIARLYPHAAEAVELAWDYWNDAIQLVGNAAPEGKFRYQGPDQLHAYLYRIMRRKLTHDAQNRRRRMVHHAPGPDHTLFEEWIAHLHSLSVEQGGAPPDWDIPMPWCLALVAMNLAALCERPGKAAPRVHTFVRDSLYAIAEVSLARGGPSWANNPALVKALRKDNLSERPCPPVGEHCQCDGCPPMALIGKTCPHIGDCDAFEAEVNTILGRRYKSTQIHDRKYRTMRALQARQER